MSTLPRASSACSMKPAAPSGVLTSATIPTASSPRRSTASPMRAASRLQIATRQPASARATADAKPRPPDAAATAARFPRIPRSMGRDDRSNARRLSQMVDRAPDESAALERAASVEAVADALAAHESLADRGLSTAVFLALRLHRPLLLEGEAGVGKTELAKVIAAWTGGELVRLQCYEGIDVNQAVYEWDYARQLLHVRAAEAAGTATEAIEDELYSEQFLVRRPLLRAITAATSGVPPVLLIDEVDRADDEFEAFLLEILSDYAVSIPELG